MLFGVFLLIFLLFLLTSKILSSFLCCKKLYPVPFCVCVLRNLPYFCPCDLAACLFPAIFSSLPLCLQCWRLPVFWGSCFLSHFAPWKIFFVWPLSAAVEKVEASQCSVRARPRTLQLVQCGSPQPLSLLPSCSLLRELSMQWVPKHNSCIVHSQLLKVDLTCSFYCLWLYSCLGPLSTCKECCTLTLGSSRGKMCSVWGLFFPTCTPHSTWMVSGWTQGLDQAISLLERIFNCKPEELSRYSSSLKCIWRLYGLGLSGVFCPSLTGVNVKVFRFLKVQVYGCASCGTSNMYLLLKIKKLNPTIPLVLLKNTLVSTEESWDLLRRITVKHNSISVCKVFSLLEMCDGLGGI